MPDNAMQAVIPIAPIADTPWQVWCDGCALPNPGRMGLGAVLIAPDGVRHTLSQPAAGHGCNNEAELRALIAALQVLQSRGATHVTLHSDNSIMVERLGGTGSQAAARLAPLFAEAAALIAGFAQVQLRWIPRHRNHEADMLSRAALGLGPHITRPRRRR